MNPEIKTKWLKALRSGEYQQGKQVLHTTSGRYCCLGVLCDLYLKETNQEWLPADNMSDATSFPSKLFDGTCWSILPPEVMEWSGIESPNGAYGHSTGHLTCLAAENDSGKPFITIANIIEENF